MAEPVDDPGAGATRIEIADAGQADVRPPAFAYDIYLSFAPDDGPEKRQFNDIVKALERRCEAIMGRAVTIAVSLGEIGTDGARRSRLDLLLRSRTLLVFGSPAWFPDRTCAEEFGAFVHANISAYGRAPVFVAELRPFRPAADLGEAFALTPRFPFWRRDNEGQVVRLGPGHDDFLWQITKLADAIAIVLIDRGEAASEPPPADDEAPPRPSPPPRADRYRTQTDDPAHIDALERGPFAAVLAARIREVRRGYAVVQEGRQRAFMVHLHGPWGSGKSSMLGLVQGELEKRVDGAEPSLVVWFNAWKHQRLRPPWWALLNTIYEAAVRRCYDIGEARERNDQRWALKTLWWRWRLRTEWVPILLIALLLGGLMFALLTGISLGTLETPVKILGAMITAGAGVYTYARLMVFGSGKAAQTYADLRTDPYEPVVRLFNRLVGTIRPPLVVFVDDLDRCDSDYVVELLEGIQTLFRDAHVTYIIAADRKWICSSFEKRYDDFAGSIGEPGRPLGHLFLDKMFQISVGLPRLTPEIQARYLAGLLAEGDPAATAPAETVARAAAERVSGIVDESGLQQAIAETASATVAEQRAVRAAAALQITSAEAAKATEHRLHKFAHLLEPNPRSMKRLVNAVGMAQARGILEGRSASPETRARWTMLTLRWPILAEFIGENPEAIRHWTPGNPPPDMDELDWPQPIKALIGNRAIMAVVGDAGGDGALTPENLVSLLG